MALQWTETKSDVEIRYEVRAPGGASGRQLAAVIRQEGSGTPWFAHIEQVQAGANNTILTDHTFDSADEARAWAEAELDQQRRS